MPIDEDSTRSLDIPDRGTRSLHVMCKEMGRQTIAPDYGPHQGTRSARALITPLQRPRNSRGWAITTICYAYYIPAVEIFVWRDRVSRSGVLNPLDEDSMRSLHIPDRGTRFLHVMCKEMGRQTIAADYEPHQGTRSVRAVEACSSTNRTTIE